MVRDGRAGSSATDDEEKAAESMASNLRRSKLPYFCVSFDSFILCAPRSTDLFPPRA